MKILRIILFFSISIILFAEFFIPDIAAQEPGWSPPDRVPGLGDEARNPVLIADQNRTVYMFTSGWVGDVNPQWGIYYTKWNPDIGWTNPVDIFLPSRGQARVKGAYLDPNGIIHLVFFGGDEGGAQLYYSRAPALEAGQVRSWSEPVIVAYSPLIPDEAVIGGDGAGNLFILFSGYSEGNGVYSIYSNDSGDYWSPPEPVFLAEQRQQLWPSPLVTYVDQAGNAYAAWGLADTSGNSLAVYFSKQNPDRMTWSQPVTLAKAIGREADTPAIIKFQGILFAIFHNDNSLWMRRSSDDGLSWSTAQRLFPHIGSNGPASLVVDSSPTMHMFFGQRLPPEPATHGLWHSVWDSTSWSSPQAIVSGFKSDDFDPTGALALSSQGNTLMVTWSNDPGGLPVGLHYSTMTVNSPQLPLQTLTAPTPFPAATQSVTSGLPDSTSNPPTDSNSIPQNLQSVKEFTPSLPYLPIVYGALPVIILLVVMAIFKSQRR